MTKKNVSKVTPCMLQEDTVVREEKPSPAPKKTGSEIDEIFAGKKRKKSESKKTGKPDDGTERTDDKTKKKMKKKKKKKKVKESDDGGFLDQPSRPRKKTQDGLSVYTEDELGINKADAGSTPLCPFDCSCCF